MDEKREQPVVAFGTLEIIGEVFRTLRAGWRLYLSWAAQPLLASIFSVMLPRHGAVFTGFPQEGIVLGVVAFLLFIPLYMVFTVRVCRHVILGELPTRNMFRQIFEKRIWRLFLHMTILVIKTMAIGVPMAIVLGLLLWLGYRFGGLGLDQREFLAILALVISATGYAASMLIAEQTMLLVPDVSVDGPGWLFRLKARARHARWELATVYLTLSVPSIVCSVLPGWTDGLAALGPDGDSLVPAWGGILSYILMTFAGAVVYKRLSPSWAAQDAEDEARAQEGYRRYKQAKADREAREKAGPPDTGHPGASLEVSRGRGAGRRSPSRVRGNPDTQGRKAGSRRPGRVRGNADARSRRAEPRRAVRILVGRGRRGRKVGSRRPA